MSWALLIIEDEPDIREELQSILSARGFQAHAASNGAEARAITDGRGVRPAVILLDMVMPVMDGNEFLARQHEIPLLADVPVIVLTAQPERAKDLPPTVRAVLEKPLPLASLLRVIQSVCDGTMRG
jgi:CheY-like chemotaxis protein